MREILEMYEKLSEMKKEQVNEFVHALVRQKESRHTSEPVQLLKEKTFQK